MLIEYKPFEPAFYHTDIADWGMWLDLVRRAGPQARVLVACRREFVTTDAVRRVGVLPVDRLSIG
jgi:L-rhamnose isomerase / sugar isomerase